MNILLTHEECETYFFNALCNAVGTGYMEGYGLELETDQEEYTQAESNLTNPCIEDVWMEILRGGGKLTFKDHEGDMTRTITLKDVHEWVPKMPTQHLTDMINECDDVVTADVLLQTVFYEGEIVFG